MPENRISSESLLGPGWKQVTNEEWTALADDDEFEDIEEEGLDTLNPWLKIGNHVYRGTHDQLIGSEILFRTQKHPDDPLDATHTPFDRTDRRITFRAMVPKPKASSSKRARADLMDVDDQENDGEAEASDKDAIQVKANDNTTFAEATPAQTFIGPLPYAPFGFTKRGKPKKRPGPKKGNTRSAPRPLSLSPDPHGDDESQLARASESPDPTTNWNESGFQIPDDGIPGDRTGRTRAQSAKEQEALEKERMERKMEKMEKSVEAEVLGIKIGRRRGIKRTVMLPGFQGSEQVEKERAEKAKRNKGKGKGKETVDASRDPANGEYESANENMDVDG